MSLDRARLQKTLIRHEGMRKFPYEDSVGKLTIGVGRNLDDVGLSDSEVQMLLSNDVDRVLDSLHAVKGWGKLNGPRQEVIANMVFNMGLTRVLKFRRMWAAIDAGDFVEAAEEMLDSKWARQVKGRSTELAKVMEIGHYE